MSRVLKWDTVIDQKTVELGRYLVDRSSEIDFSEPPPILMRTDGRELRNRILNLRQSKAHALGIEKSTLHYLRNRAAGAYLRTYGPVQRRLQTEVLAKK